MQVSYCIRLGIQNSFEKATKQCELAKMLMQHVEVGSRGYQQTCRPTGIMIRAQNQSRRGDNQKMNGCRQFSALGLVEYRSIADSDLEDS